jgi:DNA-binding NarL/FixJ family response regulator
VPVRVVIADDHPLFAEALRLYLTLGREHQIEVVGVAENGQQAVDLAVKEEADVVLMDLMMPVLDGLEATRRVRETRPEARVVILSGYAPEDLAEQALEAGAEAGISKAHIQDGIVDLVLSLAQGRASETTT